MQNVQNAAEIQQRVINLVELYRRKVGWESQTAKDAKADRDFWDQQSYDMLVEEGIAGGLSGEGPHTEVWIKNLMVNEQLLGHFYAEVAGEGANQDILDELLPDVYDKTIFTKEEESFLKSHFKERVSYIIVTPHDESLDLVNRHDSRDAFVVPNEVLKLIGSRTKIAKGSTIFYPNTGFGQLMSVYEGCKFYFDDNNAWMQVFAYANNADVEIQKDNSIPKSYDAVVSYIVGLSDKGDDIDYLCKAYEALQSGGQFILLCPPRLLVDGSNSALRRRLIDDRAIKEIIQLPQVMSNNASFETYCIIIAEKDRKEQVTTFVDARSAQKNLDNKHYLVSFDVDAFNAIMQNDGIEPRTDRRDVIMMSSSELNERILLPQAFTLEQPSEKDHPTPLSDLCTLETTRIRNIKFDLPIDTPWVKESDLSYLFKGELDVATLEKANCPNNPPHTEDYAFDDDGEFSDHFFAQRTPIGHRVRNYRTCTYVDGKSDVILYKRTLEDGVCVALIRATGRPIAISKGICVFCPKDGFDALKLLALLRLPIVYMQILAYKDYGLGKFMDMILVPTNKMIIHSEIIRMDRELSILKEQEEKFSTMKTEYINEVRIRKHDMGQKVFDLINTEDLMRYYVENRETERDLWPQIEEQLDHFRSTIHELSEMLDNLSQEEQFGTPELLDLNDYLANLQHSNNVNGFKLSYQLDRDSIIDLLISHKRYTNVTDENSIKIHPIVNIAKNDLQRVVSNILNNAQKHGFVDSSRKDYEVNIRLEFNSEKGMYQINFRNNGKPLPEGLNKMRYGIKGEKAGQTAGTGLGGSVVKSIVEHYKGDYDVLMDGDWTVIRIYLPIVI